MKRISVLLPLLALAGCEHPHRLALAPLHNPPLRYDDSSAVSSRSAPRSFRSAQLSYGRSAQADTGVSMSNDADSGGDISLNFADTDIRDVAAQILGDMLHVNYTIDPAVRGAATLRTVTPLSRDQLIPTLETLLAQNGAALTRRGGTYRVSVAGTAAGPINGATMVPLRYASAKDLAKMLEPFLGNGGKITADANRNALLISGDATARASISDLIQTFDTDLLAGQSYALLPVDTGSAKDFAAQLNEALRDAGGGQVKAIPMDRADAVLIVASQPRYIDAARRIYGLVEHNRRTTIRTWRVYYLQNSRSSDTVAVLQRALTPNDVSAQSAPSSSVAPGQTAQPNSVNNGSIGSGSLNGLGAGSSSLPGIGTVGGGAALSSSSIFGGGTATTSHNAADEAAPLLAASGGDASRNENQLRIVANPQNNAVLIYANREEQDTVESILHKIDVLPLQVRIDATIAEVTLNDALQYGVEYFFAAGINGLLSNNGTRQFGTYPGFVITGPSGQSVAIHALQDVTKVRVLSSPQLTVVDNQAAHLQVGQLVPILTQQSQSTITTNANIVNSVSYQPTGVILQVTPRVNSGGMVTMDISQEVSSVAAQATGTQNTGSPTFQERQVQSRVAVQDGQTVGLAGLIQDQDSRDNSGIPFLKDVPILGFFAGSQNNSRMRTELLVLITPHIIHDARDARYLTEDLREGLKDAALTPEILSRTPPDGYADPQAAYRRKVEQTR